MPPMQLEERFVPVIQYPLPHGRVESRQPEFAGPIEQLLDKQLASYFFEVAPRSRFLHIPADMSQERNAEPDNADPGTSPKSQSTPQKVDISEGANHWLSLKWQARRPLIDKEEQLEQRAKEGLNFDESAAAEVWGEVLARIAEDCLTDKSKECGILGKILLEFYWRRRNTIGSDERRTFQLLRSMTVTVPEEAESLEVGVPGGPDDSKEIFMPQPLVSCRTREIPVESLLRTELAVALTSEDPEMYLAGVMFANDSGISLTIDDLEHGATLILNNPTSEHSGFMRSLASSKAKFDLQRAYDSLSSRIKDPTTLEKMSRDIVNLIQVTSSPDWNRDDNAEELARISRLIAHVTQYGSEYGIIAVIRTLFDNWAPGSEFESAGKFSDFVVNLDLLRTRDDPYSQLRVCAAMQSLLERNTGYVRLEQMTRTAVNNAISRIKSFQPIRDGGSDLVRYAGKVLILGTLDDAKLEDYERFCANPDSVLELAIQKPDIIVQILKAWDGRPLTSLQRHALFIWYSFPRIEISNADVFLPMCNVLGIPQLYQLLAIPDPQDELRTQVREAALDRAHGVLHTLASTLDSFERTFYSSHKSEIRSLLYKLALQGDIDDLKPLVMYMDTELDLPWRTSKDQTVSHLICEAVGYESRRDPFKH